jgi:hypothetical protein
VEKDEGMLVKDNDKCGFRSKFRCNWEKSCTPCVHFHQQETDVVEQQEQRMGANFPTPIPSKPVNVDSVEKLREVQKAGYEVAVKSDEIDELKLQVVQLTNEKNGLMGRVGDLQQENSDLLVSNDEIAAELRDQKHQLDDAHQEIAKLEVQLVAQTLSIKTVRKMIDACWGVVEND